MKNGFFIFIKNFSYTITSNLISLLISTLMVIILPRLIGAKDYGYWQLYLFYATYVGFFQFGWNDGIYLRYGGKEYIDLDKRLFFSQFWMLLFSQIVLASILIVSSVIYVNISDKKSILIMVSLCLIIVGVRAMLLFILQGTNRIKEYAQITVMEKALYCFLIIIFLLVGIKEYKIIIVTDLIGKFISLIYAMYCCKDIVYRRISTFYFSFKEIKENISVGIKLMFANIASILIIGTVRFGIEHSWSVTNFGKVSLTLSVSSLMMLFINAVGIVMFPILRRTDERKLASMYVSIRDILMVLLFGALIIYYPLKGILSAWLPSYKESLVYMAVLFPMIVFDGKMELLINIYLKTLRKEKFMLRINIISLVLSVIITIITTIVFKNLHLAVVSIVFLLAFRSVLAELFLSKVLNISIFKDIFLDLVMTLIFILIAWFINSWNSVILYAVFYGIYLIIKRYDIVVTLRNLKVFMKA
ncbi:oligosaccharide flippase family protein [Neobacillus drentensis]|uniref:oligosaccharide flippase family protein n=1 Tax=Neobacillus drentensis TaxID=220684 RepID=UPI001F189412|nr:oligosaccharide flippase family protein [Neobacillus drentensis]ULT56775.1 oligosaccharide flippase family protein [Neobacillus drentensis]